MALRSSIETSAWPAVLTGRAATLMALQQQFEESQWWPPEKLRAAQFQQLRRLVAHAMRHVPFYADRFQAAGIMPGVPLTEDMWSRLPILTRKEVRDHGESLHATSMPPDHGGFTIATTSGSTGIPVRVRKSELAQLMWEAVNIREELWHREDPGATIARIRPMPHGLTVEQEKVVNSSSGLILSDWGQPQNLLWRTGKIGLIDQRQSIRNQSMFLQKLAPQYLYTPPSNLRLLMAHFRTEKLKLPSLRAIWTLGEVLDDELRNSCNEIFACRIIHNYSTEEIGYIAIQCPECNYFHTQDETVLTEVLDDFGRPCTPGKIGRVVVTPLHNFAMPLIRYEIGDEAEIGDTCRCGRGLTVLSRIVGRTLDYLVIPSGGRKRGYFSHEKLSKIDAIKEMQVAQRSLARIEVLIVSGRPMSDAELHLVKNTITEDFGSEFEIDITFHESLPRTPAGKLRPFISDLPQTDR